MKSLDEIFYSEFKSTMRYRKASSSLSIGMLPLPDKVEVIKGNKGLPTKKMCVTRGIQEQYYNKLNFDGSSKSIHALVGKRKLVKKKYLPNGEVRYDDNNRIMTEEIVVPRECVAIVSKVMIGVPRKFTPSDTFSYVDYIESNGVRKYIYLVPRKYVHLVNLCALVLSTVKLRSFYTGIEVTLTDGGTVYIYSVPFKPSESNNSKNYRFIKVAPMANFDASIESILRFWEQSGIMFDRNLTAFSEPVQGVKNCGIFHMLSTLDTYTLYDKDKTLEVDTVEELY